MTTKNQLFTGFYCWEKIGILQQFVFLLFSISWKLEIILDYIAIVICNICIQGYNCNWIHNPSLILGWVHSILQRPAFPITLSTVRMGLWEKPKTNHTHTIIVVSESKQHKRAKEHSHTCNIRQTDKGEPNGNNKLKQNYFK